MNSEEFREAVSSIIERVESPSPATNARPRQRIVIEAGAVSMTIRATAKTVEIDINQEG